MEIIITDSIYATEATNHGGDWAWAFKKAITDIRTFHNTTGTGSEGGVIKVPKGTYEIKSKVDLFNGIVISGEGMGSTLHMQSTGGFRKNTEDANIKYVTLEKLRFTQGATYNYAQGRCFIDFTLCYLSKIDSCIASGDVSSTGESIFTILGNATGVDGFGHFNTLSNCDILDFNTPFMIDYDLQTGGTQTTNHTNDHRIVFNRIRNFAVHMNSLNLYSGHNKFCFNAVEANFVDDTKILKVPGEANVIIGNRFENHNGTRVQFGAAVSGDDNVLLGNHYVGVAIKNSDGSISGGVATVPGDNNVLLEPGSPNLVGQDDYDSNGVHIGSAYSLEWLSTGKNSDIIVNGPINNVTAKRGLTLYNAEAASGPTTMIRRIPAYDQSGTLIGYIPVFQKP